MDFNALVPDFLILSLAGSSLSIAAYSAFKDRSDDQKLLLIIASCFTLAFIAVFLLSFTTMDNLEIVPYLLALIFYVLIFMAMLSILGFIIHRLIVDRKFKEDELESAVNIIESSRDDLDSLISLFDAEEK